MYSKQHNVFKLLNVCFGASGVLQERNRINLNSSVSKVDQISMLNLEERVIELEKLLSKANRELEVKNRVRQKGRC